METRADYVLIGAFTLAGIVGLLAFFVWLAQVQVNRQYDYYDVLFDNVAGLSQAGEVRYNGLPVGQVLALEIDPENPGKVRARIEVAAETPIREDTDVQLQVQGVTGVSYVSLTGGSPEAPLLRESVQGVPVLFADRSVVEALTQDAPTLVAEAITLLRNLQVFIGPENQNYVASILQNLDDASGQLQTALRDFSSISGTIETAAGQIGGFTGRLDEIGVSVKSALATAEGTLRDASDAFVASKATLSAATGTLRSAERSVGGVEAVIRDQVPGIVTDLGATATALRGAVEELRAEANTALGEFGTVAGLAGTRLTELKGTLEALDQTLAEADSTLIAVESASVSFEALVEGEGALLISDARAIIAQAKGSLAAVDRMVAEDVPAIVADVRGAVETANRVITEVGQDVSGFTGKLDPLTASADTTLRTATQTMRDASGTLARLDRAMDGAERTLAAAEATFIGANRVMNEEVAGTAADIRKAAAQLGEAVDQASQDLPEITGEVRETLARASAVVARLDAAVATSAPPVEAFATTGLPQFVRFTEEARALVINLERLVARVERDPARFFLGGGAPDYRR